MVGVQPQISDTTLTPTKSDKHFKSSSDQQDEKDKKISEEQSVNTTNDAETFETEETPETSSLLSKSILINIPVDNDTSTNTANETGFKNELTIKGSNKQNNLKWSLVEKKEEEEEKEGYKSKKYKAYITKKSKALPYVIPSKDSPLTDQSSLPQNIDTFTVEDEKYSDIKIFQMFDMCRIRAPICEAQNVPGNQSASPTLSFSGKGPINSSLTTYSEKTKPFLATVPGNNKQIVNMVPITSTCSYDETNNFLAITLENDKKTSNTKTKMSESIINFETVKTFARKPHPKFRKFEMSCISSEISNTSCTGIASVIYPKPIETFSSIFSGNDKLVKNISSSSVTTTISKFNLNTIKAKVERPTRGCKPKTSCISSKGSNTSATTTTSIENNSSNTTNRYNAITNYYQSILNNKIQINEKHKNLFSVQPIPPIGFENYLMKKHTYILAGNASKRLGYTLTPPPANLHEELKRMFVKQEKERQTLRIQHIVEKEKLVICVEQEILRVHGRIARILTDQPLPFSACVILKDKELVYNVKTPNEEEDNRTVQLNNKNQEFVSWLQEVDDKWEKIKESMLWRHRNEAESLYAVQKMDWKWKMVELKICCYSLNTSISKEHVSIVEVNNEFVIYQNENVE